MNDSAFPRRFAVVGNPVKHSRSPAIHEQFGRQTGIRLHYGLLESPLDAFARSVSGFFAEGGRGLNVTVPFKEEAHALCGDNLSERARLAGAVNTLWMHEGRLRGCNTDGVGLLADIARQGVDAAGKRVLLIGAGGAAKGALLPLLEAGCEALRIVNRNAGRAQGLKIHLDTHMAGLAAKVSAGGLDQAQGEWDIVVNATSSSLAGQAPAISGVAYAPGGLAYDMMYGPRPTPFLLQAQAAGADRVADGLGMLVEQAAEAFFIWNGVRPDTAPVLAQLRAQMAGH
ncbi:shikimate dehydrogenase [Pusillimonas noertemannii]|uniref:Shikimate dehydrogenase (NADP(+)) n=1 Tax=Pusillimonas noertemannii TaxID=305977 RepID=A0A2U1CQJ6_9BURK|nr:shikimate dehydrogenase [Pusillimonas noertemannii]NYT67483.1 shikimate dehydrogenase [Pusillimonas noertemannii]PVY68156.1 shikimate dehydrogenase [Pusillimonas noertemannii]TFL12343.1 shikimate dehydrogenase [Pusillimonas noertemannii]